jgi:hypothetical protein
LALLRFQEGGFFQESQELGERVSLSSREVPRHVNEGVGTRSVDELLKVMSKHEDLWYAANLSDGEVEEGRREVIKRWSLTEVESMCWVASRYDWNDALLGSWGERDPNGAVTFVLALQEEYAQAYLTAGKSLEGGPGEAIVEEIGISLNIVLGGWSKVDPHAAWKAASDPEGQIWGSKAFGWCGYLAPIEIFENLSKKEAEFAFAEFQQQEDPMFRGSMLKGMARGLPESTGWMELMRSVLGTPGSEHRDIVAVMRGGLLGRWMEVDAGAAEEWFRSGEGEVISARLEEVSLGRGG